MIAPNIIYSIKPPPTPNNSFGGGDYYFQASISMI